MFVTEGAFDALSVLEVGYNAASYNSSNNANNFIKLIEQKRPVSKIILCPDNDKAGNVGANIIKEGL